MVGYLGVAHVWGQLDKQPSRGSRGCCTLAGVGEGWRVLMVECLCIRDKDQGTVWVHPYSTVQVHPVGVLNRFFWQCIRILTDLSAYCMGARIQRQIRLLSMIFSRVSEKLVRVVQPHKDAAFEKRRIVLANDTRRVLSTLQYCTVTILSRLGYSKSSLEYSTLSEELWF